MASGAEVVRHADELAARFEDHEPDVAVVRDAAPLRAVRAAAMAGQDDVLADAVRAAICARHSWAAIAAMIGISEGEAGACFGPRSGGFVD